MSLIDPMLDDLYVEVNTPSTNSIPVDVMLGEVLHHLVFPLHITSQVHNVVLNNSLITFHIHISSDG